MCLIRFRFRVYSNVIFDEFNESQVVNYSISSQYRYLHNHASTFIVTNYAKKNCIKNNYKNYTIIIICNTCDCNNYIVMLRNNDI